MFHNPFNFYSMENGPGNTSYTAGFSGNPSLNFGQTGWGRGNSTGWGTQGQPEYNWANQSPGRGCNAPDTNGWETCQNPMGLGHTPSAFTPRHPYQFAQPEAALLKLGWPRAEAFVPGWGNNFPPLNNPAPRFQVQSPSVIPSGYPAEFKDTNDPNWGENCRICQKCGLPFNRRTIVVHERECTGPKPVREFRRATRYSGGFQGF